MIHCGSLEAGEDGEDTVLQLSADCLVATHKVSIGEDRVEVQPGVREDEGGVVDGAHCVLQAAGEGRVLTVKY